MFAISVLFTCAVLWQGPAAATNKENTKKGGLCYVVKFKITVNQDKVPDGISPLVVAKSIDTFLDKHQSFELSDLAGLKIEGRRGARHLLRTFAKIEVRFETPKMTNDKLRRKRPNLGH